jgi:4'-phosphopantetheinyl transferase
LSDTPEIWEKVAEPPPLLPGVPQVWLANLDGVELAQFASVLSLEETERARRFRFQNGQRHYTVTRGLLRKLLGGYLKRDPKGINLVYSRYGKPALANPVPEMDLRFNVSHSHGMGLLAFQLGGNIGVDIEKFRPDFATQEIADRFFAREEATVLRDLSDSEKPVAFFRCWTLKEAVIKGHGMGFSLPLAQFVVSVGPENPRLERTDFDPEAAARWKLRHVPVPAGYFGAVAMEGKECEVRFLQLAEARS